MNERYNVESMAQSKDIISVTKDFNNLQEVSRKRCEKMDADMEGLKSQNLKEKDDITKAHKKERKILLEELKVNELLK